MTTFLATSEDWEIWNHAFVMRATLIDIWDEHLNPLGLRRPMPTKRDLRNYPRKKRSNAERASREAVAASSGTVGRPTPAGGEDEEAGVQQLANAQFQEEEDTGPPPMVVRISDLTDDGRTEFQFDYMRWRDRSRKFDALRESIIELRKWTFEHVANRFRLTCCEPDASLATWYILLQEAADNGRRVEPHRRGRRGGSKRRRRRNGLLNSKRRPFDGRE
ncbi:hypothetical protein N658DRAFT_495499 [Parathielavia hyrcaniae]|uniref:Uncharacterized protein n=1 Tax=Parathielavia hyrcaniae TaxID=113614 RepID=A0AAN6Q5G7_9PEZI|nr:hypothetical protein N658DRAFT_495499 [Parathielavia hyrcaniae]